jgi:hypothetical protein
MNDALQVALDALRMAGRGDVADAWAFVEACVKATPKVIASALHESQLCPCCGCDQILEAHHRNCAALMVWVAFDADNARVEVEQAWSEAMRRVPTVPTDGDAD